MDFLRKKDLIRLVDKQEGFCVSIFLPTHRAKPENRQDPIRLKNLLRKAERFLSAAGLSVSEVNQLLMPAQKLLNDTMFWQYQSDGLAMFLSSKEFLCYRLPLSFRELAVVANRFHVKPILPLFSGDGRFFVLALSQNQVRFFQGTRHSISEVEVEGLPKNIKEALKYDQPEKQLQFHTRTPGKTGKRAAIFHGHGAGKDDAKKNILQYFHQINRGLHRLIREESAPLVFAGVDYLFSIYREANTYPYLLDSGIPGNPEGLSPEELHKMAWALVKPLFFKAQTEAMARYRRLTDAGRASRNLKTIIPAAYHGQVELLFVAVGLQLWGTFDPDTNTIYMHRKPKPGDGDLVDLAAIHTLLNKGTVYAVEPQRVPDYALLAAVFRY